MATTEIRAIRYLEVYGNPTMPPEWKGPYLFHVEPGNPTKLFWFNSYSYFTCPVKRQQILKIWVEPEKSEELDSIEIEFIKEFQAELFKPDNPSISEGWIAPSGEFYPCRYGEHSVVAKVLGAILYNVLDGEKALELNNWLKVYKNGEIYTHKIKPTMAQVDTMYKFAELTNDNSYVFHLGRSLRRIVED